MKSNEFSILDRCKIDAYVFSNKITASHTTMASRGLTMLMIKGARYFFSADNLRQTSKKDEVDKLPLRRPTKTGINTSDHRCILGIKPPWNRREESNK